MFKVWDITMLTLGEMRQRVHGKSVYYFCKVQVDRGEFTALLDQVSKGPSASGLTLVAQEGASWWDAGMNVVLWNLSCPTCLYWLGRYQCPEQGQTWQVGGTARRQVRELTNDREEDGRRQDWADGKSQTSGPHQVRVENIFSLTPSHLLPPPFIIILLFL